MNVYTWLLSALGCWLLASLVLVIFVARAGNRLNHHIPMPVSGVSSDEAHGGPRPRLDVLVAPEVDEQPPRGHGPPPRVHAVAVAAQRIDGLAVVPAGQWMPHRFHIRGRSAATNVGRYNVNSIVVVAGSLTATPRRSPCYLPFPPRLLEHGTSQDRLRTVPIMDEPATVRVGCLRRAPGTVTGFARRRFLPPGDPPPARSSTSGALGLG